MICRSASFVGVYQKTYRAAAASVVTVPYILFLYVGVYKSFIAIFGLIISCFLLLFPLFIGFFFFFFFFSSSSFFLLLVLLLLLFLFSSFFLFFFFFFFFSSFFLFFSFSLLLFSQ